MRPGAGRKPACRWLPLGREDTPRWYCVRTDAGAERIASFELGLADFEVFAPVIYRPARPARRDGYSVRPALPERVEPLFGRYIFVRFDRGADDWPVIRGLAGVDCLLGNAQDSPIPVPDEAMQLIRGLCSPNGCQYPYALDASAALEAGRVGQLLGGPFIDHRGVCEWSDAKRVRLLMVIMGHEVRITVARELVAEIV